MKVLVTGGAGFIGSHLVERLLEQGHEVVCLDNFNDFYEPRIKRRNVQTAFTNPGYTLIDGDILERELLERVFLEGRFETVVHLAAYAGVRPSIESPELYQKVNIEGTINLLEQCRAHGVGRFVFASSSSVYGGRSQVPFRETDDVMRPISPYAATKVAGEALCFTYHHLFGIHTHALRFFTVYGPRQRPEMAIHLFARRILDGEPILLFGDGTAARDYTFVGDIVEGVARSVQTVEGYEVINLGGSRSTTLARLVELLEARLHRKAIIERGPDQAGDVPVTFAEIDKARRLLGYESRTDMEKGIDLFCSWLEKERGRASFPGDPSFRASKPPVPTG
ncbi:MAG: GDP-mannose 4,6-dehydratase [Myxococcota bacterium]|jgi:UDP-glucuronate 4-epimerase|nr:GDP-mannose 4,6-dehydratase [Myxococcota bacterium]